MIIVYDYKQKRRDPLAALEDEAHRTLCGRGDAAADDGCSLTASAEELFTLPEFPVEYTGLSNQLNALLGQGYEYVSPSSGRNIQSVQMTDLNGDGYEEAVAFFRAPSGEKPLKIVIFRPHGGLV